jgi:RNA polymerase sigma-70 factor (ECF subfamily)
VASSQRLRQEPDASPSSVVRRLPLPESDAALVSALQARRPGAAAALFDRYAAHVRRVLVRVLGTDAEISDLLHDVFVVAFTSSDRLKDATAVRAWLTAIAVHTARGLIRKRKRRRVLRLLAPWVLERTAVIAPAGEASAALRAVYAVLEQLPSDDRIVFALRFIDGMELAEVAEACGISLATVKRRLARAEQRFTEAARRQPALADRIETGRWRNR